MARAVLPPERAFPVTAGAPHIRGFWNGDRIALAVIIALLPPLGQTAYTAGIVMLPGLMVALATAVAWQVAFAFGRRQPKTLSGTVSALIVAIMLPLEASLWQVALAVSFGVVIGEQIFGGYGRNFVNPATLALAFLMFSFPDGGFDKGGFAGWEACLPGGLMLVAVGIVNWRIVVAALGGALGVALASGGTPSFDPLLIGSFAFGLVFLAGDPVTAPATNWGRWVYGLIIGGLVALGSAAGGSSARDVVFACLIGSIFAPLIDQMAIWINVQRRRRRYGQS
ncbi:MAG: Na+-transporting NADH:ubiquinone oxidoreductase subunit B [Alphaproteobacteria bacterium]|jgi:Na+-transporting NADH:ubiquinone oxidoreductase subunit B